MHYLSLYAFHNLCHRIHQPHLSLNSTCITCFRQPNPRHQRQHHYTPRHRTCRRHRIRLRHVVRTRPNRFCLGPKMVPHKQQHRIDGCHFQMLPRNLESQHDTHLRQRKLVLAKQHNCKHRRPRQLPRLDNPHQLPKLRNHRCVGSSKIRHIRRYLPISINQRL